MIYSQSVSAAAAVALRPFFSFKVLINYLLSSVTIIP